MQSVDIVHVWQVFESMREQGMIDDFAMDGKVRDVPWASHINSYLAHQGVTITPFEYAAVVSWLRLPRGARQNPK